jgi:hypothetical protein
MSRISKMSQRGLGMLWFPKVGGGVLIWNRFVLLWRR